MKKILAIVLALALALSMSTVAFAAITENNGSEDAEVKVVINSDAFKAPTDPEDPDYPDGPGDPDDVNPDSKLAVYKVDIDATEAVFEYTFDADYNTETHQYDGGSWTNLTAPIKVSNHSNTAVNVTAAWKDGGNSGSLNNVNAALSNTSFQLVSAVNTDKDNAPSDSITVTIEDTVPSVYNNFTLDFVTITIAGTNAD